MKFGQVLLVLALAVLVAFATATVVVKKGGGEDAAQTVVKETRLEKVKRTGVLRCGYVTWSPYFVVDPATGKLSGVFYDIVEEMGRQLKLKIEWVGEAATGQMFFDLDMNRYDMICTALGEMPSRTREGSFAKTITYVPVGMFVRKDDARFDVNREDANKPEVTFAVMDGEFSSIGATENFPAAKTYSIPQLMNVNELYVAVATKKADAVVEDTVSFAEYDAANPGLLRSVAGGPLRTIAVGFPLPANEPAFKAMLDTTIDYLHDSGFIDKALKKHEGAVKSLRAAKHYQE
ncbi:MAG: transporter substrate-binding domain-containing protein [Alphaproteobacteria bacterium]|nr:transporter substrate-binding domain-containing protein [Alphaproteobacteria bacterium]